MYACARDSLGLTETTPCCRLRILGKPQNLLKPPIRDCVVEGTDSNMSRKTRSELRQLSNSTKTKNPATVNAQRRDEDLSGRPHTIMFDNVFNRSCLVRGLRNAGLDIDGAESFGSFHEPKMDIVFVTRRHGRRVCSKLSRAADGWNIRAPVPKGDLTPGRVCAYARAERDAADAVLFRTESSTRRDDLHGLCTLRESQS